MLPHRCQSVAERRLLLGIPSTLANRQATFQIQSVSQQRHQRIQTQQTRRHAFNRQVRPLTLRLKAQVSTAFLEQPAPDLIRGRLNAPALDETPHDRTCLIARTRREVSPWRILGAWMTDHNPSERQGRLPTAIPQRRGAADLQPAHAAIIPAHPQGLPRGRRIIKTPCQRRQAFAFERRATPHARLTRWRRFMEDRIETQGSNQTHPTASAGMAEFHDAVGLIAQHGDGDVGQPASHHPDHLARPLGDGLVSAPQALADLRRWRRHAQDR